MHYYIHGSELQTHLRNTYSNSSLYGILFVYTRINHMHRNSLYSLSRHYINSFEVYNPPPSPKKECSDLKGTISSRYLLSFFLVPWIASLRPSGACGRTVWRPLGGPGDPLGGFWGRTPPNYLLGRIWPALKWTHPPGRPYGDIKRSTRTNAQSKIIIFCFETILGVLQTPFGEPNYGDLAFRTAKRPSKVHQSEYWKHESVKLS